MSCHPIDTVTFDLWNTLIAHDDLYDGRIREYRLNGILNVLKASGLTVTKDELVRAYDDSERVLSKKWSANFDMDTGEQIEVLLDCLGTVPSPDLVSALDDPYANAVLHVEPFLVDGAREALEHCRGKGYRMALISNTSRTPGKALRKIMGKMGILELFDLTVFSNEVGYLKPHPRIFEVALSGLGSSPLHTVHVGDHDVLDVKGARDYGMRSIRVLQYAGKCEQTCTPDVCLETLAGLPDAIAHLEK